MASRSEISCSATIRRRSARYATALAALLRWTAAPASRNACFRRTTGSAAALNIRCRLSTAVIAPPISDKFSATLHLKRNRGAEAPQAKPRKPENRFPSLQFDGRKVGKVLAGSDVTRSPPLGQSGITEAGAAIWHPGGMRDDPVHAPQALRQILL